MIYYVDIGALMYEIFPLLSLKRRYKAGVKFALFQGWKTRSLYASYTVFSTPLVIFSRHHQISLDLSQSSQVLVLFRLASLNSAALKLVSYDPQLCTTWISSHRFIIIFYNLLIYL